MRKWNFRYHTKNFLVIVVSVCTILVTIPINVNAEISSSEGHGDTDISAYLGNDSKGESQNKENKENKKDKKDKKDKNNSDKDDDKNDSNKNKHNKNKSRHDLQNIQSRELLLSSPRPLKIKPTQPKPVGTVVPAEETIKGATKSRRLGSQVKRVMQEISPTEVNTRNTLILYDTSGQWGFLGELYAQMTANLVSRFGSWQAHPVVEYTAGEMTGYSAVIYLGSTYDEPLPATFLTDILAGTTPVLWMYNNIWQLSAYSGDFQAAYGWNWFEFDTSPIRTVNYKQTNLTRNVINQGGIMTYASVDPARVQSLAMAKRADETSFPWAVRSLNLTYIGEIPLVYMDHTDRYLVLADLLFDLLAPNTVERHRALVRIEDVGPNANPQELMDIAQQLSNRNVPFSVAVYPRYEDPYGVYSNGTPEAYNLADRPAVVQALQFMQSQGGTLLMHGYTHQFESLINPYNSVSAEDFEFYTAHVDANDNVIYDGPIPGDSEGLVTERIALAEEAFLAAGLQVPTIFEFPHYAGSVIDYKVVQERFGTRYDRGLYFPGNLSQQPIDYSRLAGQFFPYPVKDIYGSFVIPENIGNIEPQPFNNRPPRLPADLLAAGQANLVIRDGFASFFYHPYLGQDMLLQVVDGLKQQGYTFVTMDSLKP